MIRLVLHIISTVALLMGIHKLALGVSQAHIITGRREATARVIKPTIAIHIHTLHCIVHIDPIATHALMLLVHILTRWIVILIIILIIELVVVLIIILVIVLIISVMVLIVVLVIHIIGITVIVHGIIVSILGHIRRLLVHDRLSSATSLSTGSLLLLLSRQKGSMGSRML